jgi:hypothetical protein
MHRREFFEYGNEWNINCHVCHVPLKELVNKSDEALVMAAVGIRLSRACLRGTCFGGEAGVRTMRLLLFREVETGGGGETYFTF